jgi:signal transduction histidine kinase
VEDWRFQKSPHVEVGGLQAYAGTPLRFETETGDYVALGSLCVASNSIQDTLSKPQQIALARLGDWVVADIVQSARANRQRIRRRMAECISEAQKRVDDEGSEKAVMETLRSTYPEALVTMQSTENHQIRVEGRSPINPSDFGGGLWEDVDYLDEVIENFNHQEPPDTRVIRAIAAQCEGTSVPTYLVVASKDFRLVFDDIDAWFVQTCAGIVSRMWHKRLLTEAIVAKDKFLRGITHQLRTPIHGILGSVDLLAEELKLRNVNQITQAELKPVDVSPQVERTDPWVCIDTIKTAGRELISIVNSMITLNRWAEIAKKERHDTVLSVHELEMDLASEISKTVSGGFRVNPSIFFHHELPPNCDSIWIDFGLLKDSILPLILNAIQHTSEGIVSITVSVRAEAKELVVDVEDTGSGIHPNDQQRIFDAYEKVDVHSTRAGLGLPLACKFAALLGGSVVLVSSEVGRGSHFRATFRQVKCAPSRPLPPLLQAGPQVTIPTFYRIPSSSERISLCENFIRFLTYRGFVPSKNMQGSLIILDLEPDWEQHLRVLSCSHLSRAGIRTQK